MSSTSRRAIFVDDRGMHGVEQPVRNAARVESGAGASRNGRQAHFVVRRKPVVRLLALAVDADFATPQQPVHPAARHARELAQQEIIEPLALGPGAGPHSPHANRLISIRRHRNSLTC